MIGSTLFSIMHFNKGKKTKNPVYLNFSNELIDLFTKNKGMSIALGIVPMLSVMFIFSQLLLNSELNVTPHLFFALLIFIASLIYIYTYKYSFKLKNIFNLVNTGDMHDKFRLEEFEGLKKSNSKLLSKAGIIGFILLLVVTYILISVLQITIDNSRWGSDISLFDIFLSINSIIYFLFFLSFSFSITCAAIIYKHFKYEHTEFNKDYIEYVKSFSLRTLIISITDNTSPTVMKRENEIAPSGLLITEMTYKKGWTIVKINPVLNENDFTYSI
jgi:cytochrome c